MNILNRYLYRQTLRGLVLAFSIITSLVVVVDFVELSRRFGGFANVNTLTLIRLTLMKLPGVVEQTLPFVVLFGVMWSMFQLNRRSELVAMRAAGCSAWQFAAPPTILAALFGILATTIINPGAAMLNTKFEADVLAITRAAAGKQTILGDREWLREVTKDGSTLIIRAGNANVAQGVLVDTTFIYYRINAEGDPVFERRYDAQEARLTPNLWHLSQVTINSSQSRMPEHRASLDIPSSLTPGDLVERLSRPGTFSFWALPRLISSAKQAGLETRRYELQWQRLLALPLTLAAMALIGAAFSFRLVRLGGAFRMAVSGISIGFLLYFAGDLLQALGATKTLPGFVAVWAPPTFVFFAGLARITVVEDG